MIDNLFLLISEMYADKFKNSRPGPKNINTIYNVNKYYFLNENNLNKVVKKYSRGAIKNNKRIKM